MNENNNQNNDNLLNEPMLDEPMLDEHILDEPMSDDTVVDIELNDIELNDSISTTSSSEQCAICLDNIIKEQECINNCSHKFCKPCLDQYLDSGKTECPLCRQPIQYFEHNSEHFRLILKKVSERHNEEREQRVLHPNHLLLDRRKYMIYRFIFIALFTTNIMDMFMSNVYTSQQNLLLEKYQECEKNNTALTNTILNLEDTIIDVYPNDNTEYSDYFIIDKFRGLQSNCYLPTSLISDCFDF